MPGSTRAPLVRIALERFGRRNGTARQARPDAFGQLVTSEPPVMLQLEITSRCNLRCAMCPLTTGGTSSASTPGGISPALWDDVLDQARAAGQVFVAGFGEPLMHRDCLSLLGQLDAAGVRITLVTNGLLVNERVAAELADLEHLEHVNVSIDSPDPSVYRSLRGARLDLALAGLGRLAAAMRQSGRLGRLSVSSVATSANLGTLHSFPGLLASLGVRTLVLQGLVDYNSFAADHHLAGAGDVASELARIRAACAAHDVGLVMTTPERTTAEELDPALAGVRWFAEVDGSGGPATRQCLLPWELPYIDKDGRVFPCCFAAADDEACLGTLQDSPLPLIWNGEGYRAFRSALLDGTTTPPVCRRCTAAPIGLHPLRRYGAVLQSCTPPVSRTGRVVVIARNTGTATWTPADGIRVGTTRPRDGDSPIWHESWLWNNRVCSFTEPRVAPGETATFDFLVTPPRSGAVEQEFQLVVEHVCWLPTTRFRVASPSGSS